MLIKGTHFRLPPGELWGLEPTSPRVDLVGREGGLTLFAGFCVDDELNFVFSDMVCMLLIASKLLQ